MLRKLENWNQGRLKQGWEGTKMTLKALVKKDIKKIKFKVKMVRNQNKWKKIHVMTIIVVQIT